MVSTWPLSVTVMRSSRHRLDAPRCTLSMSCAAEYRSRPCTSAWTSNTGRMLSCDTTIGTVLRVRTWPCSSAVGLRLRRRFPRSPAWSRGPARSRCCRSATCTTSGIAHAVARIDPEVRRRLRAGVRRDQHVVGGLLLGRARPRAAMRAVHVDGERGRIGHLEHVRSRRRPGPASRSRASLRCQRVGRAS